MNGGSIDPQQVKSLRDHIHIVGAVSALPDNLDFLVESKL